MADINTPNGNKGKSEGEDLSELDDGVKKMNLGDETGEEPQKDEELVSDESESEDEESERSATNITTDEKAKTDEKAETEKKAKADKKKFDLARNLSNIIDEVRKEYTEDLQTNGTSKEDIEKRQSATALYLIDTLALRPGRKPNEKTYGVSKLLVEHIKLVKLINGKDNGKVRYEVSLKFPGKCKILYSNKVDIDEYVFNNLATFINGKKENGKIFDVSYDQIKIYLKSMKAMEEHKEVTFRTFRTRAACSKFEKKLHELTDSDYIDSKEKKYKKALKHVSKFLNHQKTIFSETQREKISSFEREYKELKEKMKSLKIKLENEPRDSNDAKNIIEELKSSRSRIQVVEEGIWKNSNKMVLNNDSTLDRYLDPRIIVAWSNKHGVGLEKILAERHFTQFQWAKDEIENETKKNKDYEYKFDS